MIKREEVQHIAKLARLGITKKEEEKFTKELSSILDYIEKLKEVDISKIEPTSHSFKIENVMREDSLPSTLQTVLSRLKIERIKKILELMPETKNGYLKVKSILK